MIMMYRNQSMYGFIGLIEFAKPFKALNKQQLVDYFVEGRKWIRRNRLEQVGYPSIHEVYHSHLNNLALSGKYPKLNKYRFKPVTPQSARKIVTPEYKIEAKKFYDPDDGGIGHEVHDMVSRKKYGGLTHQERNINIEKVTSGMEEGWRGGSNSYEHYAVGAKLKKSFPPELQRLQGMFKKPEYKESLQEAWEEARKIPLPSPTSSRFYYRKRFGKVEKVRKK